MTFRARSTFNPINRLGQGRASNTIEPSTASFIRSDETQLVAVIASWTIETPVHIDLSIVAVVLALRALSGQFIAWLAVVAGRTSAARKRGEREHSIEVLHASSARA